MRAYGSGVFVAENRRRATELGGHDCPVDVYKNYTEIVVILGQSLSALAMLQIRAAIRPPQDFSDYRDEPPTMLDANKASVERFLT